MSFAAVAKLSGRVPLVAIVPGRSFAGHAALAGLCDVIIATRDAAMGIAGPPFVKASTGEDVTADDIGPASLHEEVGAVDVVVDRDEQAIDLTRLYLDLVSVPLTEAIAPARDPATLRDVVPANSRVAYDMRDVLAAVVDADVALELRPTFAPNVLDRARSHRRPFRRHRRQPTAVARGRARCAGIRQDGALHPTVRFASAAGRLLRGYARIPRRARRRTKRSRAPREPADPRAGACDRSDHDDRGAQSGRARLLRDGDTAIRSGRLRRVADRRVRVDGPSRRGDDHAADNKATSATSLDDHLAQIRDDHSPLAFAGKFAIDDVIDPADTRGLLIRSLELVPPRVDRRRLGRPAPSTPGSAAPDVGPVRWSGRL